MVIDKLSDEKRIMNIAAVDILKVIAVLMVVLVHTGNSIRFIPDVIKRSTEFGQMGVQLLFMLSGYLACYTAKKSIERDGLKRYYTQKYLRLAPAYYVGIVGYVLLYLFVSNVGLPVRIETNTKPMAVLINLLLLNNLSMTAINNVVPGGWSIGCLWLFYCLFPLIYRLIRRLNIKGVSIFCGTACIVCIVGSWGISYAANLDACNNSFWYFNIVNQLPAFFVGIELHYLHKHIGKMSRKQGGICLAFALLWTIIAVCVFYCEFDVSFILMPFIMAVAGACWFMAIDSIGCKQIKSIQTISACTLEMLIVHPFFVYYGISYTYKAFARLGIEISGLIMLPLFFGAVSLVSILLSVQLKKLTDAPHRLYKKRCDAQTGACPDK